MKKIILLSLATVMTFTLFGQSQEEKKEVKKEKTSKFGKFIRKVGESATGINMSDETYVKAPASINKILKFTPKNCYGTLESGEVVFNLSLGLSDDFRTLTLGKRLGGGRFKVECYDVDGNKYDGQIIGHYKTTDLLSSILLNITMVFQKIPANLKQIEVIQISDYYLRTSKDLVTSGNTHESIQIRNVNIDWKSGKSTNNSYIVVDYELGKLLNIENVRCTAKKGDNFATLSFNVTPSDNIRDIKFATNAGGSSTGGLTAYDGNNNEFKGSYNKENPDEMNEGIKYKLSFSIDNITENTRLLPIIQLGYYVNWENGIFRADNTRPLFIHDLPVEWE